MPFPTWCSRPRRPEPVAPLARCRSLATATTPRPHCSSTSRTARPSPRPRSSGLRPVCSHSPPRTTPCSGPMRPRWAWRPTPTPATSAAPSGCPRDSKPGSSASTRRWPRLPMPRWAASNRAVLVARADPWAWGVPRPAIRRGGPLNPARRADMNMPMEGPMHGPVLTVVEDVWGAPFDELAAEVEVLREPDAWKDRDRLRELASSAPAITVRNRTQVDAELLTGAPGLRVVLRAGVGLENIDVRCADASGVVIVSPRDANALSVAEHTVALALALARDVVAHDAAVRSGLWQRSPGQELSGRVWGLLGAGGTGRAVARIVRGLGMRVLAYDPYADTSAARAEGIELGALDDVVGTADVLSVHLPGGAATQGQEIGRAHV